MRPEVALLLQDHLPDSGRAAHYPTVALSPARRDVAVQPPVPQTLMSPPPSL